MHIFSTTAHPSQPPLHCRCFRSIMTGHRQCFFTAFAYLLAMILLYYIGMSGYVWLLRLAAWLGHSKAKAWVQGRHNWHNALQQWCAQAETPILWMHCASLGEFEQGRPLLEALRKQYPEKRLLLSFFSPSGFQPLQHTPLADQVIYLPADTFGTARRFLEILQPEAAFFIKYEFWHGYLTTLAQRHIPTYLVGGAFRPEQPFFKWYGGFFRAMLGCFTQIFVQRPDSLALLQSIGHTALAVGDPRLDRVLAVRAAAPSYPMVEAFAQGRFVLVAGSTWPPDEALLAQLLEALPELYLIIAPHDLKAAHLQTIEQQFTPWGIQRYTQWVQHPATVVPNDRVLLLDTVGMLRSIYRYGSLAYIGGAFGAGLHNSLEAAVYGIPLLYGPRYHKFQEAIDFVEQGIATVVHDAPSLLQAVQNYADSQRQTQVQHQLEQYFQQHRGATTRILTQLQSSPPKT